MPSPVAIVVSQGDALRLDADVLALKYADSLYGLDRVVVGRLAEHDPGITVRLPSKVGFYFTPSQKAVACSSVLLVGVGPLHEFGYREIRRFGRRVLEALAGEAPRAEHVALTIHGPGYGLDERESFEAEVAGLLDAIRSGDCPAALRRVTIVEANAGRAKRLKGLLATLLPQDAGHSPSAREPSIANERLRSVGYDSKSKPHVFVAMPSADSMDDVFHYGIQSAVNDAGYLCERADLSTFTGDVMEWVRSRIESATLVVADLSDANPNVYLEVGYAWGCGRPTVLLVKDAAHLKFDVRAQRCLVYKKIKDLESALRSELKGLKVGLPRRDGAGS
ncbi:MAG: hypothetical protein MUC36_20650 [Planctomycetes bacterium]|jgi:hypothetical protein|nr:hypothetical protein [Planctomycetota bacterium]